MIGQQYRSGRIVLASIPISCLGLGIWQLYRYKTNRYISHEEIIHLLKAQQYAACLDRLPRWVNDIMRENSIFLIPRLF